MKITCGYCQGTGKDPFRLLSPLASCQVCLGRTIVEIDEPSFSCVFCQGSGVYPRARLSCTVCGGKGKVTLPTICERCSSCEGTGTEFESKMPCSYCHGLGVVNFERMSFRSAYHGLNQ